MSATNSPADQGLIEVDSFFVRTRNVMALFTDLGPLYTDYYLHLMQNELRLAPEHDERLKEALAAIALHLTARPRDERTAWTININSPPLNLFATGDSKAGILCGRAFTENVKIGPTSRFIAQIQRTRLPDRNSAVEVSGADVLSFVVQYYRQSEQLPARLFRLGGDAFGMLVAQPDHDRAWFEAFTAEQARSMVEAARPAVPTELPADPMGGAPVVVSWSGEEVRFLEGRRFRFGCGCNLELIHAVIAPAARSAFDDLFAGDDAIRVQCPRCAGRFQVTQQGMRDWLDAHPPGES